MRLRERERERLKESWAKMRFWRLLPSYLDFQYFCIHHFSGTTSPVKPQTSGNKRGLAKALYNYVGDNEDELNFKVCNMAGNLQFGLIVET